MPSVRTPWPLIMLLLLAGLFAAAQFGKLTLTLELAVLAYGGIASLLVSSVGLVGIVFGAVAGGHIARFGLRRALLMAVGGGAVLSLIQSILPAAPIMLGLRILEGFSHLAIVIAAPTLMAGLSSDRDRPVVMGIWASFFGVALALMAGLLPLVLSFGGLPAVFQVHGFGMAVVAVALWRWVPEQPRSTKPVAPFVTEHLQIYTDPRSAIAGAGFVFYTVLYIALVAVLPGALDLPLESLVVLPLISLVGTFGAGFLARHFAPPLISIVGFGLTAGAMILLQSMPNFVNASMLFFAAGLIPGGCFATIPYFNHTLADRARATGAIAQCGNVGTSTGTPIFVAALVWGNLPAVAGVAVLFCALGLLALIWLWPKATAARGAVGD